jgi:uncharacterized protein
MAVMDKRLQNLENEIQALMKDRQSLTAEMDPAWLSRYEKIFAQRGDFAVVPVEKGACGGCHMNLPPQVVHDAKRNLNLVLCGFCSRILYWQP